MSAEKKTRHDAIGRKPLTGRKPLAPPKTVRIDVDHLRTVAEDVFTRRTKTTLHDDDRQAMEIVIAHNGKPLPSDYNRHPIFITGVFLATVREAAIKTAKDAHESAEQKARKNFQNASRDAWRTKTPTKGSNE